VEEDSGDGHFSPWGPPLGSLEGGLFTGDFERRMKEGFENGGSLSLCGSLMRAAWRGGSFTGDPEGYVEEGSGDGHISP
jgi:hypothetical protein